MKLVLKSKNHAIMRRLEKRTTKQRDEDNRVVRVAHAQQAFDMIRANLTEEDFQLFAHHYTEGEGWNYEDVGFRGILSRYFDTVEG